MSHGCATRLHCKYKRKHRTVATDLVGKNIMLSVCLNKPSIYMKGSLEFSVVLASIIKSACSTCNKPQTEAGRINIFVRSITATMKHFHVLINCLCVYAYCVKREQIHFIYIYMLKSRFSFRFSFSFGKGGGGPHWWAY